MPVHQSIWYLPLLAIVSIAMIQDLRARRIRNWLTFGLLAAGLIASFLPHSPVRPLQALGGFGIAFGASFALFAMRGLGAGDVKLLAGIGMWLGPWPTACVLLLTALLGGVLIVAHSLYQRRLIQVFRSTLAVAASGAQFRTGAAMPPVKTVPYAVPIWAATLLTVLTPAARFLAERWS